MRSEEDRAGEAGRAGQGCPATVDRDEVRGDLMTRLERQFDLPAWLITQGFHLSHVQRDPIQIAFEDRHGDTVFVTRDLDRQAWRYQTLREPAEFGTAIDLLMRRDHASVDACIDRMAACLQPGAQTRESVAYRRAAADPLIQRAVESHVRAAQAERDAERDLERLGVIRGSFDRWRFGSATKVLGDPMSLGHSRWRPSDRALVIVERPIDAIAYEAVHGHQSCVYAYVGDSPSADTKRTLAEVLADVPASMGIVAAVARDRRGTELAGQIAALAGGHPVERRTPEFGSRWADQMQIEQRHRESLARLEDRPAHGAEGVG